MTRLKGGLSNSKILTNFSKFFRQNINLDTFLTTILKKKLSKRGSFGERLSKVGCELFKKGVIR